MYLVSAEKLSAPKTKSPPPTPPKKSTPLSKTRKFKTKQHPYDRWVKFRKNMGEADITRKARMKAIADFLQKVLPEPASSSSHTETDAKKKKKKQPQRHFEVGTQTEVEAIPSTSASTPEVLYETPKPRFTIGEINDDDDEGDTRSSVSKRENVGSIASPYILPYLSKSHRRHLDTIRYQKRR